MGGNGPVIGIDLGTTYSCVAIWQNGKAEIIANDQGHRITPSVVAFTDEQRFIGDAAKNVAARYPTNTIFDAKRLIGMSFHDPSVQSDMKYWPFEVIHNPEDDKAMIAVRCNDEEKHFAPEQISAMVLAKMKQTAEKFLGATVTNAVVTVPAYFNDSQRRATKDAANIARLNVIQIINEPTAAAIAYGLDKKVDTDKNVLVFDLGGGTFDVSVLSIKRGIYRVIAVSGDTHLGGQDFDNRMVAYLVNLIKSRYHKDISVNPRALGRLKTECERAKRVLSSNTHASLDVYGLLDGDDFHYTFTKAKFEDLNKELFEKCLALTETCLIDAKMGKDKIHDVVLVGGSTRIQKVQELLREFFNGKELCHSINADEAVAQGAAIRAANLCDEGIENVHQIVLCDVTPLSLGWQGLEEVYHVVIPKNTSIPYRKTWTVTTSVDNQITMHFRIYQGESPKAPDNHYLGEFNLSGVRPARRGVATAELCFDIDSSGMLEVSAVEMVNGSRNAIIFSNEKGRLSHYEINRMLTDAQNADAKDNEFKRRLEAKNAFETYIVDMRKLIRDDRIAGKLKTCQKNRIENAIDEATTWINSKNSDKIDAADYKIIIKFLESIWDPIIDEHAGFDGGSGTSDEGGALSKKERERKWFRKIGIAFGIQVGALVLDVVLAALGVPVPMIGSIIDNLQPP